MNQPIINLTIKNMVQRIIERFHPEKIILFGSCARGEITEDSDIDILIVMPVKYSVREQANEIDLSLSDRTVPLDLIVVTPEQFDSQKDMIGTTVHEAAHEGKIVYERTDDRPYPRPSRP